MFFRVWVTAKPLNVQRGEQIEFSVGNGESAINITLKKALSDELPHNAKEGLNCIATIEKKVAEKVSAALVMNEVEKNPDIENYLKELSDNLFYQIERAIYLFRWKQAISDSYNPILFHRCLHWSIDGENWTPQYDDDVATSFTVSFGLPMKINTPETLEIAQQLIASNFSEPLAHELHIEAWQLRNSNPRSALVIGVAAVETGFKVLVSTLIPGASWLVEHVPSPPLPAMLKNYLPLLPVKNKIKGEVPQPPKHIIKIISEAIEKRNRLVHGSAPKLEKGELETFLRTVRDLLYLFDYYAGHTWAFQNIGGAVSSELTTRTKQTKKGK